MKSSWKLVRVRLYFLMMPETAIDIPAPLESRVACVTMPWLSRVPVAIKSIRSNSFEVLKFSGLVCPNLNGIIISAGLPLVRMALPGRTSNLAPRGKRVASIAIIGAVVRARLSKWLRSCASIAFCILYAFSTVPRPQKRLGTVSS